MIVIVISIIVILIAILLFMKLRGKKETITNESVLAMIGGLGTGKTNFAVYRAKKSYKKAMAKWESEKNGTPPPLLVSNIPIRFKYKNRTINSIRLDKDIVLMNTYLTPGSVTLWDEIGLSASQYDWNDPNVKNELTEFVRMYRQYTKGGTLIMTDQTLDSIVKPIRDRVNLIVYCLKTNFVGNIFCCQNVMLRFTQKIDTYTADSMQNLMQRKYGYQNSKTYSTFNYYERYVNITGQELPKDTRIDVLNSDHIFKVTGNDKVKSKKQNSIMKNALRDNTLEKGEKA